MTLLAQTAAAWGFPLSAEQLGQFAHYTQLLLAWNAHTNLTAITDPTAIQVRHFLDALSCALVTGDLNGQTVVDVGAGAGFPGMPLRILFPGLRLTLVDSVGKKTDFLAALAAALGFGDVTLLTERAEVLGQLPAHRERYDWALARAVAHLATLAEYLLPLTRIGGAMLAQKGADVREESAESQTAIHLLGGSPPQLHPVQLPQLAAPHTLVLVRKVAPTPAHYPRRVGIAAKRPLK